MPAPAFVNGAQPDLLAFGPGRTSAPKARAINCAPKTDAQDRPARLPCRSAISRSSAVRNG